MILSPVIFIYFFMDTMNQFEQNTPVLEVTETAKKYLNSTASWANFFAILSFIGIGFCLLAGIMMMAMGSFIERAREYSELPAGFSSLVGVLYFGMAIICYFPASYLLKFAQRTKKALASHDTPILEEAFLNMKSFWKFCGIVTIIWLALCCLTIPIIVIAAIMAI